MKRQCKKGVVFTKTKLNVLESGLVAKEKVLSNQAWKQKLSKIGGRTLKRRMCTLADLRVILSYRLCQKAASLHGTIQPLRQWLEG